MDPLLSDTLTASAASPYQLWFYCVCHLLLSIIWSHLPTLFKSCSLNLFSLSINHRGDIWRKSFLPVVLSPCFGFWKPSTHPSNPRDKHCNHASGFGDSSSCSSANKSKCSLRTVRHSSGSCATRSQQHWHSELCWRESTGCEVKSWPPRDEGRWGETNWAELIKEEKKPFAKVATEPAVGCGLRCEEERMKPREWQTSNLWIQMRQPACSVSHHGYSWWYCAVATTRAAAAQAGISEKKAEWCEVSDLDISVQGKEMM